MLAALLSLVVRIVLAASHVACKLLVMTSLPRLATGMIHLKYINQQQCYLSIVNK